MFDLEDYDGRLETILGLYVCFTALATGQVPTRPHRDFIVSGLNDWTDQAWPSKKISVSLDAKVDELLKGEAETATEGKALDASSIGELADAFGMQGVLLDMFFSPDQRAGITIGLQKVAEFTETSQSERVLAAMTALKQGPVMQEPDGESEMDPRAGSLMGMALMVSVFSNSQIPDERQRDFILRNLYNWTGIEQSEEALKNIMDEAIKEFFGFKSDEEDWDGKSLSEEDLDMLTGAFSISASVSKMFCPQEKRETFLNGLRELAGMSGKVNDRTEEALNTIKNEFWL